MTKFRIFNTNNLWVSVPAIKRLLGEDNGIHMEVIENKKTLEDGRPCIQLETGRCQNSFFTQQFFSL